jgi:hypothetical protein
MQTFTQVINKLFSHGIYKLFVQKLFFLCKLLLEVHMSLNSKTTTILNKYDIIIGILIQGRIGRIKKNFYNWKNFFFAFI